MIEVGTTRTERRGFLHKRIAKFAKTVTQIVGATGIPVVSQVARIGGSFLRGGSQSRAFLDARAVQRARGRAFDRRSRLLPPGLIPRGPGGLIGAVPGVPGGVTGFQQDTGLAAAGACAKGFHLNRSSYFLKDGSFVAPMSRCVKNRRRNNDNGRAAMRAARRLLGRKKSQDAIDKALRAFSPPRRSKPSVSPSKGTTIVQN